MIAQLVHVKFFHFVGSIIQYYFKSSTKESKTQLFDWYVSTSLRRWVLFICLFIYSFLNWSMFLFVSTFFFLFSWHKFYMYITNVSLVGDDVLVYCYSRLQESSMCTQKGFCIGTLNQITSSWALVKRPTR